MSDAESIQLTVALPLWRARGIAWLAMESLCNQDPPEGFRWELLVCEETQPKQLTPAFFEGYRERLAAKGCADIRYISPDSWIPLPRKWRLMGQLMAPTSRAFLLHAADCYSFKERLNASWRSIVADGNDWYDVSRGYFYSFLSRRMLLFHQSERMYSQLNMAMADKHARTIPESDQRSCIDNFLLRHSIASAGGSERWRHQIDANLYASLDTNGHNNISTKREWYFRHPPARPFCATDKKLEDIGLPADVVARLQALPGRAAR